jgi:predicted ATP-dependent endonuclease of OLD family
MFRVVSIKLKGHTFLPDTKIQLVEPSELKSAEYLSLILGQNATGKSQILSCISQILVYLKRKFSSSENPRWMEKYDFELELLSNDGNKELLSRVDGNILLNNENTSGKEKYISELLPDWIITGAYTFNDKFFFPTKKISSEIGYEYIGLRSVSNAIYVNSPFLKVIENISALITQNRLNNLDSLFDVLEYEKKFKIELKNGDYWKILKNKSLVKIISELKKTGSKPSETNINDFSNLLSNHFKILEKQRKRYADETKEKILSNKETLEDFLIQLTKYSSIEAGTLIFDLMFNFDWIDTEKSEANKFIESSKLFFYLTSLEILSWKSIQLSRGDFYDFESASSGEIHMLGTFTGILRFVRPNSLILIDEPEISLHPNWQQAWFSIINSITNIMPGCHFIVASHSHFIVSDLPPDRSSINMLKRRVGNITIELLEKISPFAWSSEKILFDVFDMATDRNYYLAKRIQDITEEYIKPKPDYNKIKKLKSLLNKKNYTNLDKDDPLKIVLNQILSDEKEPKD